GLDWMYVACDVEPDAVDAAVRGLAALGFAGANVTAPYKTEVARLIGSDLPSVNTLVRGVGYSTDTAILDGLEFDRPVIVGDGGAALAFVHALPDATVFSRKTAWPPDLGEADLVIHATSVRDEVVLDIRAGQTLVDLPYPRTATALAAEGAGARVLDGFEVL